VEGAGDDGVRAARDAGGVVASSAAATVTPRPLTGREAVRVDVRRNFFG
jgi:hypothetical protein